MRRSNLTFVLLVLIAGCNDTKKDDGVPTLESLAEDGTDANELESHASALTASTTLATSAFDQPIRAAAAGEVGTKKFFFPAGCVTSEVDRAEPSTLRHVFDECSGPWGLLKVSGKVTVKYSATTQNGEPALKLEVTGDALKIRRSTADFHATAIVGGKDANRKMTYVAELSGTTARGRPLSRNVNWIERWRVGEQCLTLDGTTEGTVGTRGIKTTIERFQRCKNACPAAGGVITVENTSTAASLRIEFNGGPSVTVKSSEGAEKDITLACAL